MVLPIKNIPKIGVLSHHYPQIGNLQAVVFRPNEDSFGNPRPLPQLEVGRVSAKKGRRKWQRNSPFLKNLEKPEISQK
jgi:hypothetical protein